ncbi:MLO-like protein 1 [Bidens hawaiensis]|uniref:MLO-like protein 1 n=1 Tax=Bidens hawaiensis TaxID=980011 RepID=UPI00404B020C
MTGGHEDEGTSIEFTPTWVVAAVCAVMITVSLAVERLLHYAGKKLKKEGRKPLFQAMQKVKEVENRQDLCERECYATFLPCSLDEKPSPHTLHENNQTSVGYCALENKVPLLSLEALHHLHIFIFVLALVHVTFSVLTVVFGGAKISQWKQWESGSNDIEPKFTYVQEHDFIAKRFMGLGKRSAALGWLTHCRGNQKFNLHKYMMRALEDDSRKVVGISWYLWVSAIIFLLLNIDGMHTHPPSTIIVPFELFGS